MVSGAGWPRTAGRRRVKSPGPWDCAAWGCVHNILRAESQMAQRWRWRVRPKDRSCRLVNPSGRVARCRSRRPHRHRWKIHRGAGHRAKTPNAVGIGIVVSLIQQECQSVHQADLSDSETMRPSSPGTPGFQERILRANTAPRLRNGYRAKLPMLANGWWRTGYGAQAATGASCR